MGSVGRNRSWTTEIHHMDTLFLGKQRFHDNLKHSATCTPPSVALANYSWRTFAALGTLGAVGNTFFCSVYQVHVSIWTTGGAVIYLNAFCTEKLEDCMAFLQFLQLLQCKIVAVVLYQRTSSPGLDFLAVHPMKFKIQIKSIAKGSTGRTIFQW